MSPRLFLLPFLLLAGCGWSGGTFYSASQTQAPIKAGDYTTNESAHPAPNGTARFLVLPSGMTRVELGDRGSGEMGFVPLGADGHFYIMWVSRLGDDDVPADGVPYGLLERRPDGHYMVYLPNCSGDRAVALAAGARPSAQGGDPDCIFPSRASLESGLRAYAGHPSDGMELIPVP